MTVTGMTCATCSRMVERSLKKVDGVVFKRWNWPITFGFVVSTKIPPEDSEE